MEVIEQGKETVELDNNTSTGSVMCQLMDPEGEPLGAPLYLPQTAGPPQLQLLVNQFLNNEERLPYAFYVSDQELVVQLGVYLEKNKVSVEKVLRIVYQPQAIFRIRPVNRCSATIAGHAEAVLSVAFSPDSRHLASGSGDTTVRLWDLNTQTPLFTCTGHKNWVLYIAWSPDGKHLASGSKSGELLTWDPQTGKQSGKPLNGHKKWITGISWEPVHLAAPCRRFVSSSKDGDARIWDVTLRRCLRSLSGHTMAVTCVKWGGDGWIYTGSQDCTIKIWRPSDGTLLRDLKEYFVNQQLPKQGFLSADEYKNNLPTASRHAATECLESTNHLDYEHQFNLHQEVARSHYIGFDGSGQNGGNIPHYQDLSQISDLLPAISPPASAFLKPKCARWDCTRPARGLECTRHARGLEWCHDYCNDGDATVALNEGRPGMIPVVRPGGIDLKDGPLFAALAAKTQGKSVGIPECEGAATTKSPWNAPELFDLSVHEGESLREWLFFDKPRRAFESGNRKQRSLPDYNGRGWHESRKQVMKEFGGLKRSYYMDPQPLNNYEWHLYEYEINNCDVCALYRLELKLVDAKKSAKAKVANDSLVDLQQQMGRLNAENGVRYSKVRAKANQKDVTENFYSAAELVNQKVNDLHFFDGSDQMGHINGNPVYGPSLPYGFSVENLNNYYGT